MRRHGSMVCTTGPTCRPGTCSRTGASKLGQCWGSRSWGARTGTSGTKFCSPCRSRTLKGPRFSSSVAPSHSEATTPWSVRCGWPESGTKSRRSFRHRRPGWLLHLLRNPSQRSPAGGFVRRNSLCLYTPLCLSTFNSGHRTPDKVNFLLSRASDRPINGAQQRPHRSGATTARWQDAYDQGPPPHTVHSSIYPVYSHHF